jgi:hypothetical protein
MSEAKRKKIAVVGCNVSARMAVRALEARFPEAEVKWLIASKDTAPDEEAEISVCLPEQLLPALGESSLLSTPVEWHVHFNHHEHELISDFAGESPRRRSSTKIPLALRRKIESLGLWNDLTPRPWTDEHGVSWNWTRENPVSLAERKSPKWSLFSRRSLLHTDRMDPRYRVLGLEDGDNPDSTKVIYSAPFGSETFDALLWTSHGSRPRVENASIELKPLTRIPVGRWRTWTAKVPHKSVAFLPELSLWLDTGDVGTFFLTHGIFRSGALHRVLRRSSGSDPSTALLQIETLDFFAEPLKTQLSQRPDAMLWNFCPFLKKADVTWHESKLDDTMIYVDPFPVLHHYARGIDFWSGGAFSNIPRLLEMSALWPNLNLAPSVAHR